MRRFCWRERSEKLNWRLLSNLDVSDVVQRGDPALLEPYALHITFARLPKAQKDPTTRDAWFLTRVLQLAMEYLLFMRARDGDVLDSLTQEMRQLETERDGLVLRVQKWKASTRSGEKQVEKLHQVLQNIAKLLQIHGASPSAVATIETLLTELIVERRARQKKKVLVETGGDLEDREPRVEEARLCGFCGKLFSSAEYLEKHLVRRHGGERFEVETLGKHKTKRMFVREEDGDKENRGRKGDTGEAMQKMVQQVERALNDHEEKLRVLAEGEAVKVQQIYELLQTETKQAEELRQLRTKTDEEREELQRQLDEVYELKQKAEDVLENQKQQIQFLKLKKNMMGSPDLTANLPSRSDDALLLAETEIRNLQETFEAVNKELSSSRQELGNVQALHLSALKKKRQLADKLALSLEVSAVVLQEKSSQTEELVMTNESVQTEEQVQSLQTESETQTELCVPVFEDVGTDALILSYTDVGVQTLDLMKKTSADAMVQVTIADDPVPTSTPTQVTEPNSPKELLCNGNDDQIEDIVPLQPDVHKEDDRIPDYIQQLHIQELLNAITERAQSAANKAGESEAVRNPVPRDYSSILRHKYVRSRFQHSEDVTKERIASCLLQLEQFSRRFGVPTKSAWLSDESLQIVQQALHGHLQVLPTDVLAKMVECENSVNAIIEKEWMPMEKTRQEAIERFKKGARAKSEINQGLVRQAMAALGARGKLNQLGGALSSDKAVEDKPANTDEPSTHCKVSENDAGGVPVDHIPEVPVVKPARRYSAKNTLTVVVEGGALSRGTYLATELAKRDVIEGNGATSEVHEALDDVVENIHREDKVLKLDENFSNVSSDARDAVSQDTPGGGEAVLEDLEQVTAIYVSENAELSENIETSLPRNSSSNSIRSINVDAVTEDVSLPSWETRALFGSRSDEFSSSKPSQNEAHQIKPGHERTGESHRTEWQEVTLHVEEHSQWLLARVNSSTDVESPQPQPSVYSPIPRTRSNRFEAASSPQLTNSLESERLSVVELQPMTQSIMVSSFDSGIPSLGGRNESVEVTTSAVVQGLIGLLDRSDEAEDHKRFSSLIVQPPALVPTNAVVVNDSVMSFDDSDIEEVMLT